jgi:hypothetical protein
VKVRSRQVGALFLAVGSFLVAASATAAFAQTGDEAQLGFFDVSADATGIGASFGDPKSQPYPVAAGLVPNSVAQLSAGPSGQAQSSILWPGPLLGNAGSLANVIGTPLPPEVVANLNFPVVARANAGGGGREEKTLGPMHAVVDAKGSRATTALTDFNAPGVASAARVLTQSETSADAGKASSRATSELQGVDIAGAVKIGRVRTVATGTTDGVRATTDHAVEVTGVSVGGQAATIDADGLHVGGTAVPVGSATGGAKPVLEGLGLSAYVTKPIEDSSTAGSGHVNSGSVVIVWSPPQSGQYFTVVLGGSAVNVNGTPGSELAGAKPAGGFFAPPGTESVLPTPSFSPSADAVGSTPLPASSAASPAPAANPPSLGGSPLQEAAAVSDRVPFGWVLIGLVGACLVGNGLRTVRQRTLDASAITTRCPLERR